MKVNGTLVNYYFYCKRQCYLLANHLNLEANSELVKLGAALHKSKNSKSKKTEVAIDNIRVDKITEDYLVEIKKSDANLEASKWQLLYYLKVLKDKGIYRKGMLEIIENNYYDEKIHYVELNCELEVKLQQHIQNIEALISADKIPNVLNSSKCEKCSYFEYCYI